MSAIADFKARRLAARAELQKLSESGSKDIAALKRGKQENKKTEKNTPAPENEALNLLATLLNCEPKNAIAKAKELIALAESEGLDFVIGLGGETLDELALDTEQQSTATVTEPGDKAEQNATDLDASAGAVEDAAANVAGAADTVDAAADKVSDAAGSLEDTANQLAYSAEDIGTATAELKEATAELKKPSAARQSSRGAKAAKQKNSSKK